MFWFCSVAFGSPSSHANTDRIYSIYIKGKSRIKSRRLLTGLEWSPKGLIVRVFCWVLKEQMSVLATSGSGTEHVRVTGPVSSVRLLLLMSSWGVRIRERWRHRLISASLLERWLLTPDLSPVTRPCGGCTAHSGFKGLLDAARGHREDPRGRREQRGASGAWRLPAGLSYSPQVHRRRPRASINVCEQWILCGVHITGYLKVFPWMIVDIYSRMELLWKQQKQW